MRRVENVSGCRGFPYGFPMPDILEYLTPVFSRKAGHINSIHGHGSDFQALVFNYNKPMGGCHSITGAVGSKTESLEVLGPAGQLGYGERLSFSFHRSARTSRF